MEVSKHFKFPPLNFIQWVCTDELEQAQMNFLLWVTEGVVYGVYKVVTQSSFDVAWRHKGSGGQWKFCHQ